jgi:hypothetical protein
MFPSLFLAISPELCEKRRPAVLRAAVSSWILNKDDE